jgi:hypothetical protein
MNVLSLNIQGLGENGKKKWVKELCLMNRVNFLSLQETKLTRLDIVMVRNLWGNTYFDYACSSAQGRSGGILCMWNNLVFKRNRIISARWFVAIEGVWIPNNMALLVISVYAPQALCDKRSLWHTLLNLISRWHGEVVLMGDFNEVRNVNERYGSIFCANSTDAFNSFIRDAELFDIPLGGYSFTWSNKWASKMSKLDRFLVSDGFSEMIPNLMATVLDRNLSDHRPILLKEMVVDYGPTPFRVFRSWFGMDGFNQLVTDTWNSDVTQETHGMISFKKKLQNLKKVLRAWIGEKRLRDKGIKAELLKSISDIDLQIDKGEATKQDMELRLRSLKELGDLERVEAMDLAQKAKIRWGIEGDENTKFFHGVLKKKRR